MAYNFKNLADVELLSSMPETANVLVEVGGATKRAPQVQPVDEIAQIVGSETLAEVPEGATVLAEVNGEIKRVPSDGLGGGKALVIKSSDFDNAMAGVAAFADTSGTTSAFTFTANMTYDEAVSALANCEMSGAYLFASREGMPMTMPVATIALDSTTYVVPCMVLICQQIQLYWTTDGGISTTKPQSAAASPN